MECKVFYSWQSDLPKNINRYFIQEALERAIKAIHRDETVEVEPRIDHDTAGVAGSPDIVHTILSKIEQSKVFVCDVSAINQGAGSKSTPNPNVLVELGYAMKTLGLPPECKVTITGESHTIRCLALLLAPKYDSELTGSRSFVSFQSN